MTPLGETALLRLTKEALQGQVVILSRMVAPIFRRLVLHRAVDVAHVVAPRHVVDVVHAVVVVVLHLVVGLVVLRRSVLLPDRLHKHLTPGPSVNYDAQHVSRSGSSRYRPQGRPCLIRGVCIHSQDHTTERAWDASGTHEVA